MAAVHLGLLALVFAFWDVAGAASAGHQRSLVMRDRKKDAKRVAILATGAAESAIDEYKYRWEPTNNVLCVVLGRQDHCASDYKKLMVAEFVLYDGDGVEIPVVKDSWSLVNGASYGCWTKRQQSLSLAFDGDESTNLCFDIGDGKQGTALQFSTNTKVHSYSIWQTVKTAFSTSWIYFATNWSISESEDGGNTWTNRGPESVKDITNPYASSLLNIENAENLASTWDNGQRFQLAKLPVWAKCTEEGSECEAGTSCWWQNQWYAQCLKGACPTGWVCQKPA